MELRETVLFLVCIFSPVIYGGKLSDYLRLQKYLQDMLTKSKTHCLDTVSNSQWQTLQDDFMRNKRNVTGTHDQTVISRHSYRAESHSTNPLTVNYGDIFTSSRHIVDSAYSLPYYVAEDISPHPTKRDIDNHKDVHIEIMVVVDFSIYQKYLKQSNNSTEAAKQKILQYSSILIALVNQRFETMDDASFSIHIHICDIYISEIKRDFAWFENISRWSKQRMNRVVSSNRALKRFQKWLKKHSSIPNYDHAILVTSYILSKRRQQVNGLAYVGTMCNTHEGKSASIIHDDGDFQSAGVIAHELGHSLGATHDGEEENTECSATMNFLMAPQNTHDPTFVNNIFFFSICSVKQIKRFLESPNANCLFNEPLKTFDHDIKSNPPGEIFDENQQCRLAFGPKSVFCDQGFLRSTICSRLWCTYFQENTFTCRSNNRLLALPGTKCGNGKYCQLGECLSDNSERISSNFHNGVYTRIKSRIDHCPTGDGNAVYCKVIINASPYLCERNGYKKYCCQSCHIHYLKHQKR